jgi:hypothetical protein
MLNEMQSGARMAKNMRMYQKICIPEIRAPKRQTKPTEINCANMLVRQTVNTLY